MNYEEAVAYINNVDWFTSNLGLSRIRELLSMLGNPQDGLRFVHVAGTNGKGSTASMLSSVLTASGYRTGLYISPYIIEFNERIQIDGEYIPNEDLAEITSEIRPLADSMEDHPTVFELITAIAMVYFSRRKCDIVVLEVGLGGEMDATNVIHCPEVAVITAIDFDHTQILGSKIQEIATAKAGIIKEHGRVVNYGNRAEANSVIEAVCRERNAFLAYPDFSKIEVTKSSIDGQTVSYGEYRDLFLPLPGVYQKYNLAVALTAADQLRELGWNITERSVREGIRKTKWPARFEVLGRNPVFIVDGGHNPHGVSGTVESLKTYFPDRKIVFLLGIMADKDVESVLNMIVPLAKTVYTVMPRNSRSMDSGKLAGEIRSMGVPAFVCASVAEGVRKAFDAENEGVICALGSLYMSGDVISAYREYAHC